MGPLIGITTYGRIERPVPSDHYEQHYSIPHVYVMAVRRAGGVPVLIPPGGDDPGWLDRIDGVVTGFTGQVHLGERWLHVERRQKVHAVDRSLGQPFCHLLAHPLGYLGGGVCGPLAQGEPGGRLVEAQPGVDSGSVHGAEDAAVRVGAGIAAHHQARGCARSRGRAGRPAGEARDRGHGGNQQECRHQDGDKAFGGF